MLTQCRTCAVKIANPNAKNLFEQDDNEILLNIETLTGIRLTDDQHKPKHICACCYLDLYHSIAFRERCLNTEKYFQYARQKQTTLDPLNTSQRNSVNANEIEKHSEDSSTVKSLENLNSKGIDNVILTNTNLNRRTLRVRHQITKIECERKRRKYSSYQNSAIDSPCPLTQAVAQNSNKTQHLEISTHSSLNELDATECSQDKSVEKASDIDCATSTQSVKPQENNGTNSEQSKKDKLIGKQPMDAKVFVCDLCGHQSSNPKNLDIHILRHKGEKNFECSECGTKHYSKYLLQLHIRVKHKDEKPFKCRYCDQRFYSGSTRQRHEQVRHVRSWSYECKICGKKYNTKSCLNKHEFLHSGLRPYRCELCNVAFPRKPGLRIHCRTKQHQKKASEALNIHLAGIKDVTMPDETITFPDSVMEQLDV